MTTTNGVVVEMFEALTWYSGAVPTSGICGMNAWNKVNEEMSGHEEFESTPSAWTDCPGTIVTRG